MENPKIAVYTIALNEEERVRQWYESAKNADLLVIADTGSSDGTIFLARSLGVSVYQVGVDPWRFDVARNASLSLIPEEFDVCIQLDMDELLPADWRRKVEDAWKAGNTWPIYKHVTSRYENGRPRSYQHYFKIHPRKGFLWKYPIHEVIVPQVGTQYRRELIDLEVEHRQDRSKNRKSYLNLLEIATQELPADWRMAHYLNREYWYNKNWQFVVNSAYVAMKIDSGWDVERASTCMWASDAAINLGFKPWAMEWAKKATQEAPLFYEAWHWRAHVAFLASDWEECYQSARKILSLERQNHHLVKPETWEWHGYDLLALGAYNTERFKEAVEFGGMALKGNPGDKRLSKNLDFYSAGLEKYSFHESIQVFSQPKLSSQILISLITPTRNRDAALAEQYKRLLRQDHTNWEWLIFDDSDKPSSWLPSNLDCRIKYHHVSPKDAMTIGDKRNRLIGMAKGDWIAHIDDDDLYGPNYLKKMLENGIQEDANLVYLKSWFFVDESNSIGSYSSKAVLPRVEGWGFSYLYRAEIGKRIFFPKNNWEDHFWFQEVTKEDRAIGVDDVEGIVFKVVHKTNTSRFPWHLASKIDDSEVRTRFDQIVTNLGSAH